MSYMPRKPVRDTKLNEMALNVGPQNTLQSYFAAQAETSHAALVVDDSPEMLRMVTLFLRRIGFIVSSAPTAECAMGIDPAGFELVVTDLFMPGKNGVELMNWIRARNRRARVGIMSGALPTSGPLRAAVDGADFVLAKPFRLAEFLTALQAIGAA